MASIDILAFASGYPFHVYNRFICSLNDTGFGGTIHIMIRKKDVDVKDRIEKVHKNVKFYLDELVRTTHINCHRYYVYSDYLNKYNLTSKYVLITDLRDVLFQKNIENYNYDPEVDIYGFQETIKHFEETKFNKPWIRKVEQVVNEQIYNLIKNNQVLCAGTTIFKTSVVKRYVDLMCKVMDMNDDKKYNIDQGIHNYILYLNKLNINIKFLSNDDNLVNTVGISKHCKLNSEFQILNSKDEVSYIVHQYDRFTQEDLRKISVKYCFEV